MSAWWNRNIAKLNVGQSLKNSIHEEFKVPSKEILEQLLHEKETQIENEQDEARKNQLRLTELTPLRAKLRLLQKFSEESKVSRINGQPYSEVSILRILIQFDQIVNLSYSNEESLQAVKKLLKASDLSMLIQMSVDTSFRN